MAALLDSVYILFDSLAGYLTVVSLITGFPLVEKFVKTSGIPTSNTLLGGEAPLRFFKVDLHSFKPVECLFLFLVSYPITAAYRASSGSMPGCISLVIVLIGLLVSVESVVTNGSIEDEAPKADTTGSFDSLEEKNQTNPSAISTPINKRVSEMTGVSASSVPESSPAASTPTMSNMKTPTSNKKKKKKEGRSSVSAGPTYGRLGAADKKGDYDDLDPILKNDDEDDVPSIVTWDPAVSSATTDPDILQKRSAHRREQSLIEGDLIDSNLEPHYSNLIDSANAPIFGVDSEGRVNVWNKCAMRIVGYTPDEVMGKNLVKEFITRDYQASVRMVIDRALHGDETANYEFPLMTKEGVRIEILLNATARRNPAGEIIGVVGIGQDITGRIAQEREYTRLIDTANAPIFGVDTFGRVNIWNQCAIQLVGYSTEEVMGKNLVQEFITDDFKTAVQAVLDEALHGEETANFEFPLMTKAGVRLDVLLNATTRRDEQGNVIGVVGIGQDITGRLAQEREYTRLIDLANAPIFGVDTLGRVNVWNQCAMRLVGYSSEEVMGHSLVKEFITDDFKSGVQKVLDMALQGDETENFEFPLRRTFQ